MKIQTLQNAQEYLNHYVPQDTIFKFPAEKGLERTKKLAELLGDPQDKIKVIHIAGTSGKGSTAQFTQALLKSQGFKTGLHVSPHLADLRERFQINGELISVDTFLTFLAAIKPAIEKMEKTKWGTPTYFEILTILAYYIFYKEKVDYAVVEAGLGGWFDATNIVLSENKVCILTRIGLDHTRILGNTLSKISLQKAHIIQKKNTVFTIKQKPAVHRVIFEFAKTQHGRLNIVSKDTAWQIGPEGDFQKENASLAYAVFLYLSKRDEFVIDRSRAVKTLKSMTIQGRFEIFEKKGKKIIADGAHNPQKMSAFTKSLKNKFPDQKFTFIIAFKKGKDVSKMLKYMIPIAEKIIITQFWVDTTYSKLSLSEDPKSITKLLEKFGYKNFEIISKSKKALQKGLEDSNTVVLTGSLYFIGELYSALRT